MFTSRAEHRLLLRIDNADLRLTPKGRSVGLVQDDRWARFEARRTRLDRLQVQLSAAWVISEEHSPAHGLSQASVSARTPAPAPIPALQRLRQPGIRLAAMVESGEVVLDPPESSDAAIYDFPSLETEAKYEGYLKRERLAVEKTRQQDARPIPRGVAYERIAGLSREVLQRLREVEPETLGQAGRVPGVTPAAVALLAAFLDRWADDATRVQRSAGEAGAEGRRAAGPGAR